MENTKIIVNIDWEHNNGPDSLIILKNIIEELSRIGIEYIKLDIDRCLGLNTELCDKFDDICRENNISWIPIITNSKVLNFTRPYYSKWFDGISGYNLIIPSSHSRDPILLDLAKDSSDHLILYTGLCNQDQIDRSIEISQPDIIFHEEYGVPNIDYITYLQHISSEFEKKYDVGFASNGGNQYGLLIAASILGAKIIQYNIKVTELAAEYYLRTPVEFNQLFHLVNDLLTLNDSRGGYGARKLNKIEKAYLKL